MKLGLITYLIILLLLCATVECYGQQDPIFTQYMNNPVLINPAYAGSYGNLNFNGIFRKQWVGMEWQPTTTSFSITSPFLSYNVGIGLTFINDDLGPSLTQTGVYTDYSYHIDFDNSRLSLGLKGGFNFYQKDLRFLDTDDGMGNDPAATKESKFLFNSGIGAYYFNEMYYVALSIPKFFRNSLSNYENTYQAVGKEERHYYLTGGGVVTMSPILKFKPTFMLRIVNGAPSSFETSATLIVFQKVWAGFMYRFGDSFGIHARYEMNDAIQIGYSFDLNNSRLRLYNFGTHEIFLSYTLRKSGKRILSPRYF